MSQVEILMPLLGDKSDVDLMAHTQKLAAMMNGQVACVFTQSDPADMMAWSADGAFAATSVGLIQSARDGNDEAWDIVRKRVKSLGFRSDNLCVERLIGRADRLLARRAALSDLVIFTCETARGKTSISPLFEALLMDAHAPIFIPRRPISDLAGVALIAWDGSVESGRAAKAALPLLKHAKSIIIIQAVGAQDDLDKQLSEPARLHAWLSRHGIASQIEQIEASHEAATDILIACANHGAGLLVSGAYGHSRAREFIFGGVTRTLIKTVTSPSLFMCH
ncbi:universal stress protein [Candidatus Phycosocius spiralis]|uniref:Universal stress protein family n=1 Tax=Candidatus Phycosocius spiralis TaxID=2815099 RepID=A0ABQ4PSY5_9PROT|nr:universal stress protein [Candidatus Phycosocius spiralis]GIU66065.1 universal stress protein family [Candidatus Phycosocius spiralis]